jgi:ATP-dependent Clp protease adaptor protein ClpS
MRWIGGGAGGGTSILFSCDCLTCQTPEGFVYPKKCFHLRTIIVIFANQIHIPGSIPFFLAESDLNCADAMTLTNTLTRELEEILEDIGVDEPVNLIVWNDEVNTFDWVIKSLVDICGHTHEQAEQCAWIIHYKGKYAVKHGSREKLNPMREALVDRGIGATIEEAGD